MSTGPTGWRPVLAIGPLLFMAMAGCQSGATNADGAAAPGAPGGASGGGEAGAGGTTGVVGSTGAGGAAVVYEMVVSVNGQKATFGSMAILSSGITGSIQISGSRIVGLSGEQIAIVLTSNGPPGTFDCGSVTGNYVTYASGTTILSTNFDSGECAIEITELGAAEGEDVAGTFTATIGAPGGHQVILTDGSFRAPIISVIN